MKKGTGIELQRKGSVGIFAGILIGLLIAVFVVGGYYTVGIIDLKKNTKNDEQINEKKDNVQDQTDVKVESDYLKLIDISNFDTSKLNYPNGAIKDSVLQEISVDNEGNDAIEGNEETHVQMQLILDGRVKVVYTGRADSGDFYLSDINDAVQLINFTTTDGPREQLFYILLSNGDVYYYRVGDAYDKKAVATKVNNVSKIKRLFIYSHPKNMWELIAIDEKNQLISLKADSV